MVVVDSNVILDVITADPIWQSWSEEQLSCWLDRAPVLINPIVYAEIAFACEAIEAVDELLPDHLYTYRPAPIRKEVRPGCCAQHHMNLTPSRWSWNTGSGNDSHQGPHLVQRIKRPAPGRG